MSLVPKRLAMIVWLIVVCVPGGAEARRFSLVVGANRGDGTDEPLRFAESDARRFAQVLVEVGGVAPRDQTLLLGATASELDAALTRLDARLRTEATAADQVFIYYSGHADEGTLHLGGGRLPVGAITELARRAPVAIALVIIDSCRSGAATRLKGLRPLGGTAVSLEQPEVRGRVVIGSSGPDESAQESDSIGGSFFTQHLLAGLRGAADRSHDGVVTLEEAYAYAYAHTVESTFATLGGVQHPSFHVDLRGQGGVPLTEPGRARGKLVLDVQPAATLLVSASASHEVFGEFSKSEGPAELALPPGVYRIRVRTGAETRERDVTIPQGGEVRLSSADLAAVIPPVGSARGGGRAGVQFAVGAAVGTGLTQTVGAGPGLVLAARYDRASSTPLVLDHFTATLVLRSAHAIGAVAYREDTADVRLGRGFVASWGRAEASLAPTLGVVLVSQRALLGDETRSGVAPELGASTQLAWRIAGDVRVCIGGFGGMASLQTVNGRRLTPRADASVALQLGL